MLRTLITAIVATAAAVVVADPAAAEAALPVAGTGRGGGGGGIVLFAAAASGALGGFSMLGYWKLKPKAPRKRTKRQRSEIDELLADDKRHDAP